MAAPSFSLPCDVPMPGPSAPCERQQASGCVACLQLAAPESIASCGLAASHGQTGSDFAQPMGHGFMMGHPALHPGACMICGADVKNIQMHKHIQPGFLSSLSAGSLNEGAAALGLHMPQLRPVHSVPPQQPWVSPVREYSHPTVLQRYHHSLGEVLLLPPHAVVGSIRKNVKEGMQPSIYRPVP